MDNQAIRFQRLDRPREAARSTHVGRASIGSIRIFRFRSDPAKKNRAASKNRLDISCARAQYRSVSIERAYFRCAMCGWSGTLADAHDSCPRCSGYVICRFCEESYLPTFRDRCPDCRRAHLTKLFRRCANCRVPSNNKLCSPCAWLATQYTAKDRFKNAPVYQLPGLMNRRWQFYFHRGEIG